MHSSGENSDEVEMDRQPIKGKKLFYGLLSVQIATLLLLSTISLAAFSVMIAKAVAWGAAICWLAHAWAAYQMWLHPKNALPKRQATAAIRAEMGKIAITLLLLWVSLKTTPELRTKENADRKSTRLNSSHVSISYAVFCLKK